MKPYTHTDKDGMPWRMEGNRPISALADKVMQDVEKDIKKIKEKEHASKTDKS